MSGPNQPSRLLDQDKECARRGFLQWSSRRLGLRTASPDAALQVQAMGEAQRAELTLLYNFGADSKVLRR